MGGSRERYRERELIIWSESEKQFTSSTSLLWMEVGVKGSGEALCVYDV